jgi:glyoxylase-like metal-dependent hydrolase (beta-lactamase superfamily II)
VPLPLALIASRMGLDGRPLAMLINTHCHSDHMGGNAAVKRAYGCPVAVPAGEAPLIEAWDERRLWLGYAGQRAGRFADFVTDLLTRAERKVYGPGRHRVVAMRAEDRDPLMRALLTKTQAMFVGALEAAGETPPDTFGPPEPMLRRIVWDAQTGWQQPELDVGIPS